MNKQRKLPLMGVMAGMLVLSTTAWAGAKSRANVAIVNVGGGGYATGMMGTARNSTDTLQYIGCSLSTSFTPTAPATFSSIRCAARNASNVTVACSSTDPSFVAALHSIVSDAHIRFDWNDEGICTSLSVAIYSQYEPKAP